MKLTNNKGFTMVELLIVLAIIAVLAAVAIPVYSNQLESSRKKVDEANLRTATGLAAQDYVLRFSSSDKKLPSYSWEDNNPENVRYSVFALVENAYDKKEKVSPQNMIVVPYGVRIKGNGVETEDLNDKPYFDVPRDGNYSAKSMREDRAPWSAPSTRLYEKDVIFYPVLQNNEEAWFDIVITTGGVIKKSEISTVFN